MPEKRQYNILFLCTGNSALSIRPSNDGYLVLASCILILTCVSTLLIQGRSRVR